MINWIKKKLNTFIQKNYFGFLRDVVGVWGRSNYKNNYTFSNFVQLCNDTYNTSPDIQEAINLITKECGELPLCYTDDKGQKVDNFNPSPELMRFLSRPLSTGGDLAELFRLCYVSWVISGEIHLIKKQSMRFADEFGMNMPIDSVLPIKPNYVSEIRYVDGTPSSIRLENTFFNEINGSNSSGGVSSMSKTIFEYEFFNGYLVGQIASKIRGNSALFGRGLGLIVTLLNDIGILKDGRAFNRNMLENQGRPSGVFYYPARTRQAQAGGGGRVGGGSGVGGSRTGSKVTEFADEEDIKRKFAGVENAGKFLFLKGGLDFKETQQKMTDLDFIPGLKFFRTSVASLFSIPPELYGDTDSSTFSNRREAREFFIGNTCVSTMNDFLQFFSDQILRPHFKEFGNLTLCVDENKLDETITKKVKLWEGVEKNHNMTINEKRELCGLKPVDDENAEMIIVPSSLTLLDDLGLTPQNDMNDPNQDPNQDDDDGD